MWDLWWTKLHWNRFFFSYFCFSLPVLFHQCPILIFIHVFFLPEGQTGEAWELSKGKCSFGSVGALGKQVASLFLDQLLLCREIIAVFLLST
jgi:hypothetical protein